MIYNGHTMLTDISVRDANHSNFQGQFLHNNFEHQNYDNNLKMVPDKITGVTPTSTPVIPDHR